MNEWIAKPQVALEQHQNQSRDCCQRWEPASGDLPITTDLLICVSVNSIVMKSFERERVSFAPYRLPYRWVAAS